MARGEVTAEKLYEDQQLFVIRDIAPQAKDHLLVIPGRHISSLLETTATDTELLGSLLVQARATAERLGLMSGYRLVINNGRDAGQEVDHLHIHVLGGEQLGPMIQPRSANN